MTQQIIREAPTPPPLAGQLQSKMCPPTPDEPVLRVNNIQGNILGGFNKDFQTLLFLEIENPSAFKQWLKTQIQFIATASEVIAFNRIFKATRKRRGREGSVKATWVNVAFSFEGLKKLTKVIAFNRIFKATRKRRGREGSVKATWVNVAFSFEGLKKLTNDADAFTDEAFKSGLAARAAQLKDPVDKDGKPIGWVVGGPDNGKVDVVFIVASDEHTDLQAEVARIVESIVTFPNGSGAKITFIEEGATLPPPLSGHEHFGNLDGLSQPGIRGRVSDDPKDLLTPRENPEDPNQGKPGQDLLWSGEFVFGYEGQDESAKTLDDSKGEVVVSAGPSWADDGSYLVFRRLRQDVFKFHEFLKNTAEDLDTNPRKVSAKLVGRWPSGAPTVRTPEKDNPSLGDDELANNDFEFNGDDAPDENGFKNDVVPPSKDATGIRCPFIAHTRKTYPRNDKTPGGNGTTEEEIIDTSEVTTQTHRLLRRGIPYGPVSPSTPDNPQQDPNFVDRGLHFLAYQTSIEEQFEFVTQAWVNNANFSNTAAKGHECEGISEIPLGHDPIIGQSDQGGDRTRTFFIRLEDNQGGSQCKKLTAPEDWVIPTGGGYFFAPSISALGKVLSS